MRSKGLYAFSQPLSLQTMCLVFGFRSNPKYLAFKHFYEFGWQYEKVVINARPLHQEKTTITQAWGQNMITF